MTHVGPFNRRYRNIGMTPRPFDLSSIWHIPTTPIRATAVIYPTKVVTPKGTARHNESPQATKLHLEFDV